MSETKKLREVTDPSRREHYYRYSPDRDQFEFRYTTRGAWVLPCHDLLNENPAFIRLMADLKENPYVTTVTRPRVIPDPRDGEDFIRYHNGEFQFSTHGNNDGRWVPLTIGMNHRPEVYRALADLSENPTEEVEA